MVRPWTNIDNNVALGYLKAAIDNFNKRANQASDENDSDDEYNGVPALTEDQQRRLIGSLHCSFDMLTEKEAYEKG